MPFICWGLERWFGIKKWHLSKERLGNSSYGRLINSDVILRPIRIYQQNSKGRFKTRFISLGRIAWSEKGWLGKRKLHWLPSAMVSLYHHMVVSEPNIAAIN